MAKKEDLEKIIEKLEEFQNDLSPYSKEWSDYWEAIAYLKKALTRSQKRSNFKIKE